MEQSSQSVAYCATEKNEFPDEFLKAIENEESHPVQAYDYLIPGEVSSLPISRDSKYFYALVRNLCNSNGIDKWRGSTWAKNSFFAEKMEVSERTIQRYLTELVKHGALVIELFENKKFGVKRCIWLMGAYEIFKSINGNNRQISPTRILFQKFYNHDKIVVGSRQNCRIKREFTNNTLDIQKKDSPAAPKSRPTAKHITLDFEKREFIGITPEDLKAWKEKYNKADIDQCLKEASEWAMSNYRKNYRTSINAWISNNNKGPKVKDKPKVSEEVIKRNKKKAEHVEKLNPSQGNVTIGAYAKGFLYSGDRFKEEVPYDISESQFDIRINQVIRKGNLRLNINR